MINAFYSGLSGTKSLQSSLDVSANNIANVNTAGYKAQQTNFSDLIYTGMSGENTIQIGNGVKVADVSSLMSQGRIEETGRQYDFAILGAGYFAVRDASGKVSYTRDGNFSVNDTGEVVCLVTKSGEQVLDINLEPVVIPLASAENTEDSPEGESTAAEKGVPGVFVFANPEGLDLSGGGKLTPTNISGEAQADKSSILAKGVLEVSNVDLVTEMTNMMEVQRGFQFSAKLIQTADELENIANTLRG